MNMAETASNISAQAKADPISDFRINEKSVVLSGFKFASGWCT